METKTMYKTEKLNEPQYELFRKFIEKHELTYPRLSYSETRKEFKLSIAAEKHDPVKIWGKALKHFKTTLNKTRAQSKDGRIAIFFIGS